MDLASPSRGRNLFSWISKIQNLSAAFPPEQYLPDMARACSLASVHAGGLVEPLYRLHATRLKILQQPQSLEPAALALIARCAGLLEFVHAGGAVEQLFWLHAAHLT